MTIASVWQRVLAECAVDRFGEALQLARSTLPEALRLAAEDPRLAVRMLGVIADLERLARGPGARVLGPADADTIARYREALAICARVAVDEELGAFLLKIAAAAVEVSDTATLARALDLAGTSPSAFHQRIVRETRAMLHARAHRYGEALEALGDTGGECDKLEGALLFGLGRWEDAIAVWARVASVFGAETLQGWASYRAGDLATAKRKLRFAIDRAFEGSPARVIAERALAIVEGTSATHPHDPEDAPAVAFDPDWGPVPRPELHEVYLQGFARYSWLDVIVVTRGLVEGIGAGRALADLLVLEVEARSTTGERYLASSAGACLRRALALRESFGADAAEIAPLLYELFYLQPERGGVVDQAERARIGERYLALVGPAQAERASTVASLVADSLQGPEPRRALDLSRSWFAHALAAGVEVKRLARTLARLERDFGDPERGCAVLELAIGWLDPERNSEEIYRWTRDLAWLREQAGHDATELRTSLANARRQMIELRLESAEDGEDDGYDEEVRTALDRATLDLLEPYLVPPNRFERVPWSVMIGIGERLGASFLKGRANARPSHQRLLSACRRHAVETTFDGFIGDLLEVVSLTTRDTKAVRRAFATADEVRPTGDGLVYFWWD